MSDKRLYRSSVNYMLAGVCGGIGEYFNIDPTLIRLAWVIVTCMSFGSGIIAYIIAAIVIQKKEKGWQRFSHIAHAGVSF